MSQVRVERLLNLLMALQAATRPLTVSEIGRVVAGYTPGEDPAGHEAFRRMFERDKEELREQGVPIEVVELLDGEIGYRVPRRSYALPEISLDAEEISALALAARLWDSAAFADAGGRALRKLGAGAAPVPGAEAHREEPALSVRLGGTDPAVAPLLAAVRARRPVRFDYRTSGEATPRGRSVDPWGVVSWRGRWYLVGRDRDRDAARVYRLSRVSGPVARAGSDGSATAAPAGTDCAALVRAGAVSSGEPGTAVLEVPPGAAHVLRREATGRLGAAAGGAELISVPYADLERFADRLAALGPAVLVREPPQLRAAVTARLHRVLAATEPAGEPAGEPA